MENKTQFNVWYFILASLAVLYMADAWKQYRQVEPISYSEFQNLLETGKVKEIAILDNVIQGTLTLPEPNGRDQFITTRVELDLARDLAKYNVKFTGVVQSTWLKDLLGWVVPAIIFFGLWMFLMRRFAEKQGLGGGFMSIGKSKAKIYMETDTKVSFDDVAGVDEAKDELREVVNFLKAPEQYSRLGGRLPKGVLLVGPPGTGKKGK